jgi:spore cortex biosynthesis protein YabQ
MSLLTQFELFLFSIFVGIYLGVTYDLIYYFVLMHLKKIQKAILDVLYFIIQSFIVFRVMFKISNGIIPIYCYGLFIIGFIIYHYKAKKYYEERIEPLKRGTTKTYKKLLKIGYFLCIEPLVNTYTIMKYIGNGVLKYAKKVVKALRIKFKRKKKNKNKNKDTDNIGENKGTIDLISD